MVPQMQNNALEEAALGYEAAAADLELAARHCRTAAQHFRDGEIPRAAAHAWAAFGHVRIAEDSLQGQARYARSQVKPPLASRPARCASVREYTLKE